MLSALLQQSTTNGWNKEKLYQYMIQQLHDDGYFGIANLLADRALVPPLVSPLEKDALFKMTSTAYALQKERTMNISSNSVKESVLFENAESNQQDSSKQHCFITRFITTHKESCKCAKYSPNGKFVATGSMDRSIKILDVEKMHFHNQTKHEVEDYESARPVIRTLYDHAEGINEIDFHPYQSILFSASKDQTVKLFDYAKISQRRSIKEIQETHNVRSLSVHPTGDYLLVGTEHPLLRLYDIQTLQSFCSSNQDATSAVNQVRVSIDGKMWVTGYKDGSIRLWDGSNGKCFQSILQQFQIVDCVQFSKNGHHLLAGGVGSHGEPMVKLFDLQTFGILKTLKPISSSLPSQKHQSQQQEKRIRTQSVFNFDESLIISSDKHDAIVWDTKTGELLYRLTGHNRNIRYTATSPIENSFITCSDDSRARFIADEFSIPITSL